MSGFLQWFSGFPGSVPGLGWTRKIRFFPAMLSFLGILLALYSWNLARFRGIEQWPSTDCLGIKTGGEGHSFLHHRQTGTEVGYFDGGYANYIYEVEGVRYLGWRGSPNEDSSQILNRRSENLPLVYYHPRNPKLAVLKREKYEGSVLLTVMVAIVFLLLLFHVFGWLAGKSIR